jgi:hypothetical protein
MRRIERAMIAVVSAFVVALAGTVLIATQVAASDSLFPDDDTVVATILVIGGIGAICAAIGTAVHSRPEALLAGSVGLVVAVAQVQRDHTTPAAFLTALILTVLALLPYLAGFGVVTLVTARVAEPRRTPYEGEWRVLATDLEGLTAGDDVTLVVEDRTLRLLRADATHELPVTQIARSGSSTEVRLNLTGGRTVLLDWCAGDDGNRLRSALTQVILRQ